MRIRGYITLTTVIILGAVALSIVTTLLLLGTSAARNSKLNISNVEAQTALTTCSNRVLLLLRDNTSLTGNNNMDIYGINCQYSITSPAQNLKTIVITVSDSVTRTVELEIEIDSKLKIVSYQMI